MIFILSVTPSKFPRKMTALRWKCFRIFLTFSFLFRFLLLRQWIENRIWRTKNDFFPQWTNPVSRKTSYQLQPSALIRPFLRKPLMNSHASAVMQLLWTHVNFTWTSFEKPVTTTIPLWLKGIVLGAVVRELISPFNLTIPDYFLVFSNFDSICKPGAITRKWAWVWP